ncbi:hypothetical protein A0H81_00773 [Grifola frondosa]|uniref:Uncharacterized protein n=1 Tax=Grifola frondosa TaxID=5627 RepID=A0A1C7MR15_GRIFR|nr:hypothetical protein A0H81_00773 [Grifola frondosa]
MFSSRGLAQASGPGYPWFMHPVLQTFTRRRRRGSRSSSWLYSWHGQPQRVRRVIDVFSGRPVAGWERSLSIINVVIAGHGVGSLITLKPVAVLFADRSGLRDKSD